jgi:RimJ/RimL family protein N-acetyltransferase
VTAASRVLVDYALRERGLNRAEWRCRADNERSAAVARRLGMTLDGTLRGRGSTAASSTTSRCGRSSAAISRRHERGSTRKLTV